MKIKIERISRMSLAEFAEANDLTLVLDEYAARPDLNRWGAHFDHCEIREGECMLTFRVGRGPTPEAAVAAYAGTISGELLVYRAMHPDRKEIVVPTLDAGWLGGIKFGDTE